MPPVPKPAHKKKPVSGEIPESVKQEVLRRSKGLCEGKDCPDRKGDWRGFVFAHWPKKGMGGTRMVYTPATVRYLCHPCHNRDDHNLREG